MDTSRDSGRYSPSSTSTLSRSSSFRSSSRTSLIRRNQSISAKQIRFYRNGDKYFGGLKLAVSPERYKEFDSLLAELSVKLDLATGAVRYIFNAEDGSLITDISQLQYGIPYVCCSGNMFRPLDEGYGKQNSSNWSMNRQKHVSRSTHTLTSLETNTQRDALVNIGNNREFIKPKLVTVIKNGKPPQKKVTMLLNQKTAVSYDQVLDHLSARGCLGKVDKLYALDGKLVRDLRDLFDDDTVFIAFASSEKFPEDGIELDTKNYRITPYRELKRPSNLKRSSSLRSASGKFRDENENMKGKSKSLRPKSIGPGAKLITSAQKSARGKVSGNKKMNGDVGKEELYPTAVFERESSDSARKMIRGGRKRSKLTKPSMDMYSTVWLSDYESVKSDADSLNQSVISSLNQSRSTLAFSEMTTPFETPASSRPITPSRFLPVQDSSLNYSIEDDCLSLSSVGRKKLQRTLSLPESEFATLDASGLQERFARLQLEQENKELKKLTHDLQDALEKLEEQFVGYLERPESDQVFKELDHVPRSPLLEQNRAEFSYENDLESTQESLSQKQIREKNDNIEHGCCKVQ